MDDASDERQTQFHLVPLVSADIGPDVVADSVEEQRERREQSEPVGDHELRHEHENPGRQRQFRTEAVEQIAEGGNDPYGHHGQRHAYRRQDDARIAQRGLDLRPGRVIPIQVEGQLAEDLLEVSGGLADSHQTHEELREDPRVTGERFGQWTSRFQGVHHLVQGTLEHRAAGSGGEPGDGAEDRHTGTKQAVHLTAELDQVLVLDLREEQEAEVAGNRVLLDIGLDVDRGQTAFDQARGGRIGSVRLDRAVDRVAVRSARPVAEYRHHPLHPHSRITSSTVETPSRA